MIGVRDWYIGCARPSQGRETSSTLVSRCYFDAFAPVSIRAVLSPRLPQTVHTFSGQPIVLRETSDAC